MDQQIKRPSEQTTLTREELIVNAGRLLNLIQEFRLLNDGLVPRLAEFTQATLDYLKAEKAAHGD